MNSRGSDRASGRLAAVIFAAACAVTAAACAGETQCEYIDEPLGVRTGDVAQDIHRCWQGIGDLNLGQDPGYLVVYDIRPPREGEVTSFFREVQSANRLYPSGNIFEIGFTLDTNDGGTPIIPSLGGADFGLPPAIPEINDTSLIMNFIFQTAQGPAVLPQALRRASACTGFGFETAEQQCQPSPAAQ